MTPLLLPLPRRWLQIKQHLKAFYCQQLKRGCRQPFTPTVTGPSCTVLHTMVKKEKSVHANAEGLSKAKWYRKNSLAQRQRTENKSRTGQTHGTQILDAIEAEAQCGWYLVFKPVVFISCAVGCVCVCARACTHTCSMGETKGQSCFAFLMTKE